LLSVTCNRGAATIFCLWPMICCKKSRRSLRNCLGFWAPELPRLLFFNTACIVTNDKDIKRLKFSELVPTAQRGGRHEDLWLINLFCSSAVLDPRVGHTMDVLSPFIPVLCHSDWLLHGESCPRHDVVHPGRARSSSPACTWHCSLHYLFLHATPLFPHGVTNSMLASLLRRRP